MMMRILTTAPSLSEFVCFVPLILTADRALSG